MWNLYDDLYIGIPSGIRIDSCIIGKDWTAVRANGNIGVAKTLELPGDPEKLAASFTGAYLRETASHLKWNNLTLAGVGVAAMNAWYNTAGRAEALGDSPDSPAPDDSRDMAVLASEALITRALPMFLDIDCENCSVIIEGYSLPCSALFFSFDLPVREIHGFYTRQPDSMEAYEAKDIDRIISGALPFTVRFSKILEIRESAAQIRTNKGILTV